MRTSIPFLLTDRIFHYINYTRVINIKYYVINIKNKIIKTMKKIEDKKKKICNEWFKELRNSICKELQSFENTKIKFKKTEWNRDKKGTEKIWRWRNECFKGISLKS